MHNGFVNVDKEKMSKSLGNFVTVRDVLQRNDPEGFRWFLLGAHYRGPIQFDTEQARPTAAWCFRASTRPSGAWTISSRLVERLGALAAVEITVAAKLIAGARR